MDKKNGMDLTSETESWASQTQFPDEARAAIRFALTLNTRRPGWLLGRLTPSTRYSSQRLLEDVMGDDILSLLVTLPGKAHKQSRAVVADVGIKGDGHPCAFVYLSAGLSDQCWLRLPHGIASFAVNASGSLTAIGVSIPGLGASGRPATMFPGLDAPPSPKLKTASQGAALKLVPLLLAGSNTLDSRMRKCVDDVRKSFPAASVEVVVAMPRSQRASEICNLTGITGFPSLVVYVNDQITFYYEGLVSPEVVSRDLASFLQG